MFMQSQQEMCEEIQVQAELKKGSSTFLDLATCREEVEREVEET